MENRDNTLGRWTDQALTTPPGSRGDVDKFRKELTAIVGAFDAWPQRPAQHRPECYEKAAFVVVDGNLFVPVYHGDMKIKVASMIGYTEVEYRAAKQLLANTKVSHGVEPEAERH